MSQIQSINLDYGIKESQKGILNDKFKRKIQFLQLVLCQNQTIKTAATLSKINFATAKVVLRNFRNCGFIKNSDKDYEKQIDMLRQIACIKYEIKQEKIQKREQEFKILCQKIKTIQPSIVNKVIQSQMKIQSQIRVFQEELQNQEQIQLQLLKSVLLEQIKLMKSN
ncbi:unnamed protein product [Paramecium primaurelia]|uniref:Uncharacterized protein n=1 Tax=Paramecium primaurelia TaxID=5886 RepID=A0A8S1PBV2_PARPR|nr:unnamed protein product [Paramecium primaurelia]